MIQKIKIIQNDVMARTFKNILINVLLFLLVICLVTASPNDDPDIPTEETYKIKIDLPKDAIHNLVVTNILPEGLIYKSDSLKVTGIATSPVVTVRQLSDENNKVAVNWSFSDVDNSADLDLVIEFVLMAANIEENEDGAVLPPCKTYLRFEDENGQLYFFSRKSNPVKIVEPALKAERTVALSPGKWDTATYTLAICHTPSSHFNAFDARVTESIPNGMIYCPESAEILSGPPGHLEKADPSNLAWHFDRIDLARDENCKILLKYEAVIDKNLASMPASEVAKMIRDNRGEGYLTWYSAPGNNQYARFYAIDYGNALPELPLSIKPNKKYLKEGEVITYTYSIKNDGNSEVRDLVLVDDRLGPIDLNEKTLLPGDMLAVTKDYKVSVSDFPGPLENYAHAHGKDAVNNTIVGMAYCSIDDYQMVKVDKTADKKEVKRGETVNYTISILNQSSTRIWNVTVKDVFKGGVEILSASPNPGSDGMWHFSNISANYTNITLKVKVPEMQDFEFGMEGKVSGKGFVNVENGYSTSPPCSYVLANHVYVTYKSDLTGDEINEISDQENVIVGGPTTELKTKEHGSGTYESEEQVDLITKDDFLEMEKDVSATYEPSTLKLYNNRTVTYSSRWTEGACAKNWLTGTSISEFYRYANSIDRESHMKLDKSGSEMDVDSKFDGMGHIGIFKRSSFESHEDYVGSFNILENAEEGGSSVTTNKSASGKGFVAVNKKIKNSQKTYEYGTGSYDSEELITTSRNYIAKDISLAYSPSNQSLTETFSVDGSMKWKEGMSSKNPQTSFISEEYTSLDRLDKVTVAKGLNEMDTEVDFLGKARYRILLKDQIDLDEQYEGDYALQRQAILQGVPKYDRPHLSVTKELVNVAQESGGLKEKVLEGENRENIIQVATYNISIENDGNRALAPIYVKDVFPPGSLFMDASMKPSELTLTYANWTLTHLAIGDISTISLRLNVTNYLGDEPNHEGDEMVNRVFVCGGYDGNESVCVSNFSAQEIDWLTCCLEETLYVTKTAQVDQNESGLVRYTIEIQNLEDSIRVADVTDTLPRGMVLLDTTVPFSSYENDTIIWNLVEIGPFETETITYKVKALRSGRFVNSVFVEARSVEGPATPAVYAGATVVIDKFEGERPAPGWQPPDWGFEYPEDLSELSCEGFCDLIAPED